MWGRTVTLLKDANPALGANSPIVGAIYWRERLFEVNGHRKSISDIKRKPPGFVATKGQPQSKSKSGAKSKGNRSRSKTRDESRRKRDRSRDVHGRAGNEKDRKHKSRSNSQKKKKEPAPKVKDSSTVVTPGCTSCLGFTRRSFVLFSQIGLGDWWRSVTCNTRYWRWSADRTEYELVYHHEEWKALINLADDDDEKSSRTVTVPARPPHMRTRSISASFAARDSTTISPGRSSGFSASTAINNRQQQHPQARHSRHSSARFSVATIAAADGDDKDEDEKRSHSSAEDVDPEKAKEERRTSASLFIPYRNHLFHKTKPAVLKMKSRALLQDEVFLLLVLIYSETKRQDKTNSSGGW